jgi:hypothetical protein
MGETLEGRKKSDPRLLRDMARRTSEARQRRLAMGLQPVTTAATVRENQDRPIVTDGPFAETKEVLGGFEIVECKNLDEALATGAHSFHLSRILGR